MDIQWKSSALSALDALTVYEMFALRQRVFVLEQQCLYPDIDAKDKQALHLLGTDTQHNLIAYLRILAPGIQYPEPAIGRVLVAPSSRRLGVGRKLMDEGVRLTQKIYPGSDIRISAQSYLLAMYQSSGFVSVGEAYLEDGIPHQEMLLKPNKL